MNLFLVYSPGHSGTAWFNECLNLHPYVHSLSEACHVLNFDCRATNAVWDRETIAFFEREAEKGAMAAGLVKSFRPGALRYVRERGGKIIQLVRNPIKIVDFKTKRALSGDQYQRHVAERIVGKKNASDKDVFAGMAIRYSRHFTTYWRQAARYPVVKLEELNHSLSLDGAYMRSVLEGLTQISWDVDYLYEIRDNLAPGCEDQLEGDLFFWPKEREEHKWAFDPTPYAAWASWTDWQRKFFKAQLAPIMDWLEYEYEVL